MIAQTKRSRSAVLAAAVLSAAVALAACGSKGGGTGEPSGTAAPPAGDPTAPKADKTYKLSWVTGQSTPVDPDGEIVKYWEDKLNVDFDIWNVDANSYNEVLNLKFASGEIPDRLLVRDFASFQKYVNQDVLAEIPLDMLKKYAPNLYSKTEKEFPKAFDYAKVNGKIYGIPTLVFYDRFHVPVVWRGDWLKNVGIAKTPETLQEFETALYKFVNDDPDKNGKKDTYGLSKSAIDLIYGAFGYQPKYWTQKDGKLVYGGVQPEMKEALAVLNKWYKDGIIDPEFVSGENKGGYWALSHAFINGRIGLTSHGYYYHWKPLLFEGDAASHDYLEVKKVNPQAADQLVYGLPAKGPQGKMGAPQGSMLNGIFIAFGKQLEKEPDKLAKALQVSDSISGESYENYLTGKFGIKGKHWDFNDQQLPVLKNNINTEQLEKMGGNSVLESIELPEFSAMRNKLSAEWATANKLDQGGIRNELLAPLPSQGKFGAELDKLLDQTYLSIIMGDKPISAFDEFVQKWRSGGGAQLEKEANDWFAAIAK